LSRRIEPYVPTSAILERLIQEAPADDVTLASLLTQLRSRSFGVILLPLGILGLLPLVSPVAGLRLAIPSFQMIRADAAPKFPKRIAALSIATDKLAGFFKRVVPTLRYLEGFVRQHLPSAKTQWLSLSYWQEFWTRCTVADITPQEQRRFREWLAKRGTGQSGIDRILSVGRAAPFARANGRRSATYRTSLARSQPRQSGHGSRKAGR
jgi:Exopolysaccharide synthesis, ExoD